MRTRPGTANWPHSRINDHPRRGWVGQRADRSGVDLLVLCLRPVLKLEPVYLDKVQGVTCYQDAFLFKNY
jgi:hypothetical protein